MKILIVDDDPVIRRMIQEVLKLERYQTVSAQHGKEALDYLRETMEDHVVVMGGIMPAMGGRQAIEEALQDDGLAARRVFIPCSANGRYLEWAANRLHLPDVALILKPYRVEQPLDAVEWGVKQFKARRSNHYA